MLGLNRYITWAACEDALLHVIAWHSLAASSNAWFIMLFKYLNWC